MLQCGTQGVGEQGSHGFICNCLLKFKYIIYQKQPIDIKANCLTFLLLWFQNSNPAAFHYSLENGGIIFSQDPDEMQENVPDIADSRFLLSF